MRSRNVRILWAIFNYYFCSFMELELKLRRGVLEKVVDLRPDQVQMSLFHAVMMLNSGKGVWGANMSLNILQFIIFGDNVYYVIYRIIF